MVTRRGAETAVLVPVQEWRRLQSAARPSLKQLLLSDQARSDLIVPARGKAKPKKLKRGWIWLQAPITFCQWMRRPSGRGRDGCTGHPIRFMKMP